MVRGFHLVTMEGLCHVLFRLIILGILSSTTADENFAYPPIPYNRDGTSYLNLVTLYQRVPESERQEPFPNYQYEEENDYLYPPYIDQYYYSPYDFNSNGAGNFYYYNYLGYDTGYDYNTPVQIFPSRFPPPIEKLLERIQNYFSTYNYPVVHAVTPGGAATATTTGCDTSSGPVSVSTEAGFGSAHHNEGTTTMRTDTTDKFTTRIPVNGESQTEEKENEQHGTQVNEEFMQQETEKSHKKEDTTEGKEEAYEAEMSTKPAAYETTTFVNEVDNT